ncbi:MAG: RagB/SusD family nutrient uptake outer membrane protein [Puia sp.]
MKKFSKILWIWIAGLTVSSCTKMLDLTPVSQISNSSFWKTESDAKGATAGMYAHLRTQAINNLFLWGEARSDAMGPGLIAPVFQNWYLNILTPDNSESIFSGASTDWLGLYTVIHDCNLILNYVPGISFASQDDKNKVLAQAYAMRAYTYFVLVRTWGDVPLVTDPVTNLKNIQIPRAAVSDVFKQIKGDIDQAVTLFPDNSFPTGRYTWSQPAVNALKADVYLWTGKMLGGGSADFTTALTACNEVQNAAVTLLPNFADVFNYNNEGNQEMLFEIRRTYAEDNESSIYAWMYIIPPFIPTNTDTATINAIGVPGGAPYMSPSVKSVNEFTADDTRKMVSLTEIDTYDQSNNKTYLTSVVAKFNGIVLSGVRYFINDYIVYRYADVLLMKAEAENALGTDPSAEINLVRQRAYGTNYSSHVFVSGAADQNDLAILDERYKELMFEGKRWWDLIRFGQAFDQVPSLMGMGTNNNLLLFPINTNTLSLNAALTQNPGY